jgi:hypothetical protein
MLTCGRGVANADILVHPCTHRPPAASRSKPILGTRKACRGLDGFAALRFDECNTSGLGSHDERRPVRSPPALVSATLFRGRGNRAALARRYGGNPTTSRTDSASQPTPRAPGLSPDLLHEHGQYCVPSRLHSKARHGAGLRQTQNDYGANAEHLRLIGDLQKQSRRRGGVTESTSTGFECSRDQCGIRGFSVHLMPTSHSAMSWWTWRSLLFGYGIRANYN